ncbi:uncharacterized protein L3040_009180 [Drepanopeziza brunnea f. sp. 'multigermtubi']|uniref:Chromo domain-containing protein n=1 Tax=Marssonina brunnea f. sp. multigermtubi (strain MB_m1) TaxID=1072389 RepID=K1WST0_MARBU|nr:uncharacterized protein MBM_06120 [Drepanopeziza brunnea f. sp. 'multigermtubi' MB_m1]EKD15492.1 hypothetical protein MBM_06120 [Drepanopeziza brunnea f. sp. 'multigermtubi' MB_m1]KAJ5032580.1 hypothetical protein L3040_009180 [Drepanopeziza brunnea f. sp. 'multigermtubi']
MGKARRLRQKQKRAEAAAPQRLFRTSDQAFGGVDQEDNNNFLDFVVAERPRYIPGSGPPLAPISIMPAHTTNKTGIIIYHFQHEFHPRYVVSYVDKPQLRISVAPENILNWVSAKTFEEYEWKRSQELDRSKPRSKHDPAQQDFAPRDDGEPKQKGKPGRKRKHEIDDEPNVTGNTGTSKGLMRQSSRAGPRKPIDQNEPALTSPQRPTLTSHSAQRGLADMADSEESSDDEDDEVSTDVAIEAQLHHTMAPRSRSRLGQGVSVSTSLSPEPNEANKTRRQTQTPKQLIPSRDTSRQTGGSVSRSGSVSTGNEAKRQRRSSRQDSFATTSSREARRVYDDLERRKSQTSKSTIVSRYSTLNQKVEPEPEPEPEPESGGEEYEVEEILGDEIIHTGSKNKRVVFYHIKWVGFPDITMEPYYNVGDEAVANYKKKKRLGTLSKKGYKVVRADGTIKVVGDGGEKSDSEPLFAGGKRSMRDSPAGQVVDDEDDEDDNDS